MIEAVARVLRQRRVVANLLADLTAEILKIVPADWVRYDLEDQGRLWSRSVKPGAEPERPGLGAVPRMSSREFEGTRAIEGGFEAVVLLGIGEATGRLILRRRSAAFTDDELKSLRAVADVLSLGLRARPFEPPPKPRGPFDEGGPLV